MITHNNFENGFIWHLKIFLWDIDLHRVWLHVIIHAWWIQRWHSKIGLLTNHHLVGKSNMPSLYHKEHDLKIFRSPPYSNDKDMRIAFFKSSSQNVMPLECNKSWNDFWFCDGIVLNIFRGHLGITF